MIKEKIFKYKYRPKTIDELILLPRIKKIIDGPDHLLLHGSYGVGKTALVNILCSNKPHLELNSSLDTSIDILRTKVDEFCSTMSMFDSKDDIKIVFMDELDGVSSKYQEALKVFIERNERNVRFIATTNHIDKIDKGVLDRFLKIDFNPIDNEEILYLKNNYAKRLLFISKKEEINISNENIKSIVNKNFPSFRRMLSNLQYIKNTGDITKSFDPEVPTDLYDLIFSEIDTEKTYHFLMDNFGSDNIGELIQMLGRPFIEYTAINKKDWLSKLGNILVLVTEYADILDRSRSSDPLIIGCSLIYKIQTI